MDWKPCNITDRRVIDAAHAVDRILVTVDLDSSDIRHYPRASHKGFRVLRPQTQGIENALALLLGGWAALETKPALRRLWSIQPERVRIRE